jgi:hypothetical protein
MQITTIGVCRLRSAVELNQILEEISKNRSAQVAELILGTTDYGRRTEVADGGFGLIPYLFKR